MDQFMERNVFDKSGNQVYCNLCGSPIVVNPFNSGDYYPTSNGIQLMGYCKNRYCHVMIPILEYVSIRFGNNQKKKKCKEIACKFRLGFIETINFGLSIESNDPSIWKEQFIKGLSEIFNISVDRLERSYCRI